MIRVLVAAASPVARAGLEVVLARGGTVTVIGTAATTDGLADVIEGTEPDVVLLVIERGREPPLPLALGPDALPRSPAVVVLGESPLDAWAGAALRAGARAVLPADAAPAEILAALEAAAAGLVALPAELVGAVLPRPASARAARAARDAPDLARTQPLTPREIEVLGLLAAGLANRTIAARLGISEHTVKTHVGSLFAKLDVSTRAEAVARGIRLGLILV